MKKGVVYILLLTYSISMLKPVLPYFSNSLAHLFWYSKHMATVHYAEGKFHVHKEVMQEERKHNTEKNTTSNKNEPTQNDYLPIYPGLVAAQDSSLYQYYSRYPVRILPEHVENIFAPPKSC